MPLNLFKKVPRPSAPADSVAQNNPMAMTPQKQVILANRREILADLAQMAVLGHIAADSIVGQIRANLGNELAEDRRQLDIREQLLEAKLRDLDARYPIPAEPKPEAPLPEPGRQYRRLSENRHLKHR